MKHLVFLSILILVSCGRSEVGSQSSKEGAMKTPSIGAEEGPGTAPVANELDELAKLSAVNAVVFAKYFQQIQPGIYIYRSELTPEADILDFLPQAENLVAQFENKSLPAGSIALTQLVALHTTLERAKGTVRFPYSEQGAAANNALYLMESAKPWEVLMLYECGSDETDGLVRCSEQVIRLKAHGDRVALTSFANTAHKFYEILCAAFEEYGKQSLFDPVGNRMRIRHKLTLLVDAASTAASEVGLNYQFPIP